MTHFPWGPGLVLKSNKKKKQLKGGAKTHYKIFGS